MGSKKPALGRGLNALLPSIQEDSPDTKRVGELGNSRLYNFEDRYRWVGRVAEIGVEHVRPNPYQPRQHFDETALDELAASIRQLGIIQPITVRDMGDGHFEIISGERRLRAARRAGLNKIPAYVREADTEAMLEMALVENVQREELNPIEVAFGYQRLIEECNLTQEQVALKVSKNRATVTNFLRLLKLPPRIQAALRDGSISVGHARALINVTDEAVRDDILQQILNDGLSVRDVEDQVRAWNKAQEKPGKTEGPSPVTSERDLLQIKALTDRLRSHFSTQIRIRHNAQGGGRIEMAYYSEEDLERLMELLAP